MFLKKLPETYSHDPVLQPALKVLQVLDLGENLLGNEGIQVIREPLMQNICVLQLGLQRTGITCEGTDRCKFMCVCVCVFVFAEAGSFYEIIIMKQSLFFRIR